MQADPVVWVLLGKGAGGNAQMLNLAETLGWPFDAKQLVYNPINLVPNLLLGPSLLTLDRRRSTPLQPPWPDLVIAASRRSVPVARWIRRQSRGHTRLVHLLHAMAPLQWFDLIITTPQYGLPQRANVIQILAPLNRIPAQRIDEACRRWMPRLAHLPRPWLALLVGGNSSSYILNAAVADRIGREASQLAANLEGSVLVTTSPRTSPAAAMALFKSVEGPAYCYQWRRDDPDNPYPAFLGLADSFMVTADSASQVIEASLTGKEVKIFDWPLRPTRRYGPDVMLHKWLSTASRDRGPGREHRKLLLWFERMVEIGLIKPPRDFRRYHEALRSHGLLSGATGAESAQTLYDDDLERVVTAIRRLFVGAGCAREERQGNNKDLFEIGSNDPMIR